MSIQGFYVPTSFICNVSHAITKRQELAETQEKNLRSGYLTVKLEFLTLHLCRGTSGLL